VPYPQPSRNPTRTNKQFKTKLNFAKNKTTKNSLPHKFYFYWGISQKEPAYHQVVTTCTTNADQKNKPENKTQEEVVLRKHPQLLTNKKQNNQNKQQPKTTNSNKKRPNLQENKSNLVMTPRIGQISNNFSVSSPNIAQIPSEDPTSRAIGGCGLS
jgi:hypothetical protein